MALHLAEHVLTRLTVSDPNSLAELESRVGALSDGFGIFFSQDGREELIKFAQEEVKENLDILTPRKEIGKWKYQTLQFDGCIIGELVEIPKKDDLDSPPTEAEKVLVRAWCISEKIVDKDDRSIRNAIVILWKKFPHDIEKIKEIVKPILNIKLEEYPYEEKIFDAATITLKSSSKILTDYNHQGLYNKLFYQAILNNTIRWRYLCFYRIFEYGYLENILERVKKDFLSSPKSAISTAEKSIENEVNQLVNLVEESNLWTIFEDFPDILKELIDDQNRFAASLKRECNNDPKSKELNSKFQKGALICYKIRCAIVHAGTISMIYEKFDDADKALTRLSEPLEKAVIKYLEIDLI